MSHTGDHERLAERWREAIRSFSADVTPTDEGWAEVSSGEARYAREPHLAPSRRVRVLVATSAVVLAVAVGGVAVAVAQSDADTPEEVALGQSSDTTAATEPAPTEPSTGPTSRPESDAGGASVELTNLPEGAEQVQANVNNGLSGEEVTSVLHRLPGRAANGRDVSVRVTVIRSSDAAESFAALRASGKEAVVGAPLTERSVRDGTEALIASFVYGEDTISICKWLESPDTQIEVATYNTSEDELVRYADGVRLSS